MLSPRYVLVPTLPRSRPYALRRDARAAERPDAPRPVRGRHSRRTGERRPENPPPPCPVTRTHTTEIRVRYAETDAMGVLHHAGYLVYFEIGRTEALRADGGSYAAVERSGRFLVVVEAGVKYRSPARYDDLLTLTTTVARVSPAKLEHGYELRRGADLIATGRTVLACVDADGKVHRVTDALPALAELM